MVQRVEPKTSFATALTPSRLSQMQYWDMAGGEFCAQAGAVDDIPGAVTAVLPDHLTVVA
jgi:hypothetical protein